MSDEYTHRWDSPEYLSSSDCSVVRATPNQLLTGLPVGTPSHEAYCTDCKRTLREGEGIVVYAYQSAETQLWNVARCYCRDCRVDAISSPTLSTSEVLAAAVLGTVADVRQQTHQFCLLDIERIDASPPCEGTPP